MTAATPMLPAALRYLNEGWGVFRLRVRHGQQHRIQAFERATAGMTRMKRPDGWLLNRQPRPVEASTPPRSWAGTYPSTGRLHEPTADRSGPPPSSRQGWPALCCRLAMGVPTIPGTRLKQLGSVQNLGLRNRKLFLSKNALVA